MTGHNGSGGPPGPPPTTEYIGAVAKRPDAATSVAQDAVSELDARLAAEILEEYGVKTWFAEISDGEQ